MAEKFAYDAAAKRGGDPWIMPLLHRVESQKRARLRLKGNENIAGVAGRIADAWDDGYESVLIPNFSVKAGETSILVVRDPARLRSPQARFATASDAPQAASSKARSERNLPEGNHAMHGLAHKRPYSQAERLSEAFQRAPIANALSNFEKKASAYRSTRDPGAIGPLAFAARVLATHLGKEGLKVTTSELVNAVRTLPGTDPGRPW